MQFQPESPPAYLLDLAVRNVRCFGPEEQILRLSDAQGRPAPWTVILGDNGVGKTTLLQCLVALEPRRHYFRASQDEERPLIELSTSGDEGGVSIVTLSSLERLRFGAMSPRERSTSLST